MAVALAAFSPCSELQSCATATGLSPSAGDKEDSVLAFGVHGTPTRAGDAPTSSKVLTKSVGRRRDALSCSHLVHTLVEQAELSFH